MGTITALKLTCTWRLHWLMIWSSKYLRARSTKGEGRSATSRACWILVFISCCSSKLYFRSAVMLLRSLCFNIFYRSIVKIRILIARLGYKLCRLLQIIAAFSLFYWCNFIRYEFWSISSFHFHSCGTRSIFHSFNRCKRNRLFLSPFEVSSIGCVVVTSGDKASSFLSGTYMLTASTHITKALASLMIQFCNDTNFRIV